MKELSCVFAMNGADDKAKDKASRTGGGRWSMVLLRLTLFAF
jgi:hypothetical protein